MNRCLFILALISSLFVSVPFCSAKELTGPKQSAKSLVDDLLKVGHDGYSNNYYKQKSICKSLESYLDTCGDLLVRKLETSDGKGRQRVEYVLYKLSQFKGFRLSDKSVNKILELMSQSDNTDEVSALIKLVGKIGPQVEAVESTIYDIIATTDKPRILRQAVRTLAQLARSDKAKQNDRALKVFLKMLDHDAPGIRAAGAEGLRNNKFDSELVIPALVNALDDDYFKVRQSAAYSLRLRGPEAIRAIPKLIEIAKTETGYGIRSYSVHALQSIGPDDPRVLSAFSEFLDDPNMTITALSHISGLGENAVEVAPKVANFLSSNDRTERRYAVVVLRKIGTRAQLPQLKQALKDTDSFVRIQAKSAIKSIKKKN